MLHSLWQKWLEKIMARKICPVDYSREQYNFRELIGYFILNDRKHSIVITQKNKKKKFIVKLESERKKPEKRERERERERERDACQNFKLVFVRIISSWHCLTIRQSN